MQERPHLAGTKCAVQADTEWLAMADAHVECLRGLARERAAGLIDDGTGDEDWHFVDEVHLLKQFVDRIDGRSEEHTSELQSLMRISYAVFCLKKKKTNKSEQ